MPESREQNLERLHRSGIVAVVRGDDSSTVIEVCRALLSGGVDVLEVTFTIPGAHRVLEQVTSELGQRALIGAGTVLDAETARIAVLSGAEFVVSPVVNLDVIATCRRYSKLVMPGAFSPTEVLAAWQAGADVVKVFPCDTVGPAYLRALRGPLPQVRLLPTGGVTLASAEEFLLSGAFALGVGSALVEPQAVKSADFSRIEKLANRFVQLVAQARSRNRA